jgi:hypothetical protein
MGSGETAMILIVAVCMSSLICRFFSLATLAECCRNKDFGTVRCGFAAILLIE